MPLAAYAGGEIAGLAVATCTPYRAVFVGFGLEGTGPAAARAAALDGIIQWFMAPPPSYAMALGKDENISVGQPGQYVTHSVTLRNTGRFTDTFSLLPSGSAWPTTFWNGGFTSTLATNITLAPCARQTIGIRTDIPNYEPRRTSDNR